MKMSEKEARDNLISISREHLPNTLLNSFIALLIWLFGVLVFLPLAYSISPRGLPLICSLIILTGFSIFIFRTFDDLRPLLDSTSGFLAYIYIRKRKAKVSGERLKTVGRHASYVITAIILYLLYSPLLLAIQPALNGLVLIPVILWIFWTLFRTVNVLLLK
jgi:hypothetical protein